MKLLKLPRKQALPLLPNWRLSLQRKSWLVDYSTIVVTITICQKKFSNHDAIRHSHCYEKKCSLLNINLFKIQKEGEIPEVEWWDAVILKSES